MNNSTNFVITLKLFLTQIGVKAKFFSSSFKCPVTELGTLNSLLAVSFKGIKMSTLIFATSFSQSCNPSIKCSLWERVFCTKCNRNQAEWWSDLLNPALKMLIFLQQRVHLETWRKGKNEKCWTRHVPCNFLTEQMQLNLKWLLANVNIFLSNIEVSILLVYYPDLFLVSEKYLKCFIPFQIKWMQQKLIEQNICLFNFITLLSWSLQIKQCLPLDPYFFLWDWQL